MKRSLARIRRLAAAALALVSIAIPGAIVMAHTSGHPVVYPATNSTQAYWTFGHDWRALADFTCGGRYDLGIANTVYRGGGSSMTIFNMQLKASNLDGANPEAGIWYASFPYDGSRYDGDLYDWQLSSFGTQGWIIPTGSLYIYDNMTLSGTSTPTYPAFTTVYHSAGDGLPQSPYDSGTLCMNFDRVIYAP